VNRNEVIFSVCCQITLAIVCDRSSPDKPKKEKKERKERSPAKKPKKSGETTAGSGDGYKSKEFISDNEGSSSSNSEDDKPLKRKDNKKDSDSDVGEVLIILGFFNAGGSVVRALYL